MAVAQVGALISFVDATTIVHSDFNSNFTDLRTAFNNLVTGANQLAGGITVNGALTVASGGVTVTGNSTITGTLGGVTTLTATTLAGTLSTVTQNSVTTMTGLVTVGALASGTIASGFGNIDNAANTLTTGAGTFGGDVQVSDGFGLRVGICNQTISPFAWNGM